MPVPEEWPPRSARLRAAGPYRTRLTGRLALFASCARWISCPCGYIRRQEQAMNEIVKLKPELAACVEEAVASGE